MSKFISFFIAVILFFEAIPIAGTPTVKIDATQTLDEISTRATGFLYGLAENGVPSEAMTDSLDIASVSQKVAGGLQHPTGDVDNIQSQLTECDYIVVYLQDSFDTWYYCHDEIMEMRRNGTYDWKEFLYERYLPIVEEKVRHIEAQSYAENIVYCIFNECDNAVWFGDYIDDAVHYNEKGKQNFFEAWKITYDLIKSIAPDAKIGGPGFYDYVTEKITDFFTFCKENNCVPEITIYHELNYWSIPDWETHVEDYRRIEDELSIEDRPIIVTEYGCMEECGNPALMIQYIEAMENTNTYGNVAFWRLANNLNDTAADDNSPNSNWWLYRKYAEMDGLQLKTETSALKNKQLYDGDDWRLSTASVASITNEKDEINIIMSGSENKRAVKLTNLDETNLGSKVTVKVEYVYYKGLMGIVSSPTVLKQYSAKPNFGKLNINIEGTDTNAVYFITVSEYDENAETIRNKNIPVRYEFEDGELQGTAYTYDSAYATTGKQQGMTGGYEKVGDGVKLTFKTKSEGYFDLDIIFGKHNDSGIPSERDFATAIMIIDGEEEIISFQNTIKSEYTTLKTITKYLSKGKHTIEFYHNDGTFVLDSMIVAKHTDDAEISVLEDSTNGTAYLAVAPSDGYYKASINKNSANIAVDGASDEISNGDIIYLRRGLNEIEFGESTTLSLKKADESAYSKTVTAKDFALSEGAYLDTDKYGVSCIYGISSLGGKATFNINAPKDGTYRLTVNYANNSEGGVHSYNVDLIENYMTVTANGESQDIFCRNTYSKFTYKTMTFNLTLKKGDNEVAITNSGNTIFNNTPALAPQIESITVNALTK